MTRSLTISDTGLRLIKAFEGFRSEDTTLVTGIRVVGYGHRLSADDEPSNMSRLEAEELLLEDLEPIEVLINDEVHAPLTQGQYDALCSLGFNIGLDALRQSDIVRALNNGRVLDAANGFDVWRKATINGETYVVDALMRRRTAEKSLFLRNEPAVPAPSAMLSPKQDGYAPLGPTDDGLPRVTEAPDVGVIEEANLTPSASESLIFSGDADAAADLKDQLDSLVDDSSVEDDAIETNLVLDADDEDVVEIDDAIALSTDDIVEDVTETITQEDTPTDLEAAFAPLSDEEPVEEVEVVAPSSIAQAADSLGDRLTALLDSDDEAEAKALADALPTSLVDAKDEMPRSNLVSFPNRERVLDEDIEDAIELTDEVSSEMAASSDDVYLIDNLAEDDVIRASRDPENMIFDPEGDPVENAARYLERRAEEQADAKPTGGGFWIPLVIGSLLLGASFVLMGRGATQLLSTWGPTAVIAAAITGGLMMLFAVYAFMRGRAA